MIVAPAVVRRDTDRAGAAIKRSGVRNFDELTDREILALAIGDEGDGRLLPATPQTNSPRAFTASRVTEPLPWAWAAHIGPDFQ
jgi:hypothetical protein